MLGMIAVTLCEGREWREDAGGPRTPGASSLQGLPATPCLRSRREKDGLQLLRSRLD
jgi:hypothetical protein